LIVLFDYVDTRFVRIQRVHRDDDDGATTDGPAVSRRVARAFCKGRRVAVEESDDDDDARRFL